MGHGGRRASYPLAQGPWTRDIQRALADEAAGTSTLRSSKAKMDGGHSGRSRSSSKRCLQATRIYAPKIRARARQFRLRCSFDDTGSSPLSSEAVTLRRTLSQHLHRLRRGVGEAGRFGLCPATARVTPSVPPKIDPVRRVSRLGAGQFRPAALPQARSAVGHTVKAVGAEARSGLGARRIPLRLCGRMVRRLARQS